MPKVKQLNVVVKGKIGALDRLCSALGEAKININGMMATREVVRMLVDDPEKASSVLDEIGIYNAIEDVLAFELNHMPGSASAVTTKLANQGVNIRYAYTAAHTESKKAILVLSVADMTDALEATR